MNQGNTYFTIDWEEEEEKEEKQKKRASNE